MHRPEKICTHYIKGGNGPCGCKYGNRCFKYHSVDLRLEHLEKTIFLDNRDIQFLREKNETLEKEIQHLKKTNKKSNIENENLAKRNFDKINQLNHENELLKNEKEVNKKRKLDDINIINSIKKDLEMYKTILLVFSYTELKDKYLENLHIPENGDIRSAIFEYIKKNIPETYEEFNNFVKENHPNLLKKEMNNDSFEINKETDSSRSNYISCFDNLAIDNDKRRYGNLN